MAMYAYVSERQSSGRELKIPIEIVTSERIGQGATASVYPIHSHAYQLPSHVGKLYRDPSSFNLAKIEAMLTNPPKELFANDRGAQVPQFAWPTHIVFENASKPLGFLMRRIDDKQSLTLDYFYDRILMKEQKASGNVSLAHKLTIARNLAGLLADLHAHRHYVIDFKPQNIKIFKETKLAALLDCDSFSIESLTKATFPATHYSSEYIAPEALLINRRPQDLHENQDRYALAVVLFQLFNNGIHPFAGIPRSGVTASTTDDKVRARLYPHGLAPHADIEPRPDSIHTCFDDGSRKLFDRAFMAGANERPSASEWRTHFNDVLTSRALTRCRQFYADPAHMCFLGKPCGACYLERTLQQRSKTSTKSASKDAPTPALAKLKAPVAAAPASSMPTVGRPAASIQAAKQGGAATWSWAAIVIVFLGACYYWAGWGNTSLTPGFTEKTQASDFEVRLAEQRRMQAAEAEEARRQREAIDEAARQQELLEKRRVAAQREAERREEEVRAAAEEAEKNRLLNLQAEEKRSSLIWNFQNNYPTLVVVAFYSQDRAYDWAGDDRASGERGSAISSGGILRLRIRCQPGERICYGAWARRNVSDFWGVGPRNQNSCRECIGPGNRVGCDVCCYTCGSGETRLIDLDP